MRSNKRKHRKRVDKKERGVEGGRVHEEGRRIEEKRNAKQIRSSSHS